MWQPLLVASGSVPLHAVIHREASVTPVGSTSVSSYKHFGDCIIFRVHKKILLNVACLPLSPLPPFPWRNPSRRASECRQCLVPCLCVLFWLHGGSHCYLHSKSFFLLSAHLSRGSGVGMNTRLPECLAPWGACVSRSHTLYLLSAPCCCRTMLVCLWWEPRGRSHATPIP